MPPTEISKGTKADPRKPRRSLKSRENSRQSRTQTLSGGNIILTQRTRFIFRLAKKVISVQCILHGRNAGLAMFAHNFVVKRLRESESPQKPCDSSKDAILDFISGVKIEN